MNGEVESGKCDICGKEAILHRKYYRYNVKCECHSPNHFEIVWHCDNCDPVEPEITKIHITTTELKQLQSDLAQREAECVGMRGALEKVTQCKGLPCFEEWDLIYKASQQALSTFSGKDMLELVEAVGELKEGVAFILQVGTGKPEECVVDHIKLRKVFNAYAKIKGGA